MLYEGVRTKFSWYSFSNLVRTVNLVEQNYYTQRIIQAHISRKRVIAPNGIITWFDNHTFYI